MFRVEGVGCRVWGVPKAMGLAWIAPGADVEVCAANRGADADRGTESSDATGSDWDATGDATCWKSTRLDADVLDADVLVTA